MKLMYVEDEEDDVLFLSRAISEREPGVQVVHVPTVDEAIAYLRGQGRFKDRTRNPLPDALVVDLWLGYRTGLELLEWLRQEPILGWLPRAILSSCDREQDRDLARKAGAEAFILKEYRFTAICDWVVEALRRSHAGCACRGVTPNR